MSIRLKEWADGMDWDWVISRQRVFATPIPAWFCSSCNHSIVANESELPLDPTETQPLIKICPQCGSSDRWVPEMDGLKRLFKKRLADLVIMSSLSELLVMIQELRFMLFQVWLISNK
jgi:valyl-tRNA synthetase